MLQRCSKKLNVNLIEMEKNLFRNAKKAQNNNKRNNKEYVNVSVEQK